MARSQAARKLLGAWYTPPELLEVLVTNVLDGLRRARPLRVLDPACGDGRVLGAVAERVRAAGGEVALTGCDIDPAALGAARTRLGDVAELIHADALTHDWGTSTFDVVAGNPPFLSQMATATARGGASRHGGGPYADAAAEFLALSIRLARPDGGRVALVLPQSIVGSRDAGPVREAATALGDLTWSWWQPRQQHFDAAVNVCVLGFERPARATSRTAWTEIVTDRLGVPRLDHGWLRTDGTLGDRAELNANFRDEYYALVPAVGDDVEGPPLVTSGLIDPGVCWWGRRPVTFAKHRFQAPRVDLDRLTGRFPRWAQRKLVPKVLVANQTRIVEAVADPEGRWLPGVPVSTVTPPPDVPPERVWELAAVLTSPVASAMAWQHGAGTGLSTGAVRLGPKVLAAVPWPSGDLGAAVAALRAGGVAACGAAVLDAYALADERRATLTQWWTQQLPDRS